MNRKRLDRLDLTLVKDETRRKKYISDVRSDYWFCLLSMPMLCKMFVY